VRTINIVILFIAIVMGVIAAFLAYTWLQSQQHASAAAPTGTVVVATVPLGFGAAISEDKISEIPWAAKTLPEGAFATKQQMLKDGRRVALTPIERGEPVLRAKITAPGQRGSLSTLLDQGMRAVTVRVDDVRGVAGFILPSDRVDVVLIRTEAVASGQSYSELILQNVKVLAVDQLAGQQPDQATVLAKAVTLEVTAEGAQKVLLATNIGRLSLILRQPGEAHSAASRRITERDLSNMPAPPPAPPPELPRKVATAPAPPPPPPPVQHSDTVRVVIVHGLKREEYNVRRY
jgi:pilus assembly protein CpaB